MRRFSGVGGEILLASDPVPFVVALEDAGDGFDWRPSDPSLSHWMESPPVEIEIYEREEWMPLPPVVIHHESGRVGTSRSMPWAIIRATGWCIPGSVAGIVGRWDVEVQSHTPDTTTLGSYDRASQTLIGGTSATLHGCELDDLFAPFLDGSVVIARLRHSREGAFIGVGTIKASDPAKITISFTEKGVVYVHV